MKSWPMTIQWSLGPRIEVSIVSTLIIEPATGIGKNGVFACIGLLISAIVLGLEHWYPGKSEAICITIIGLLLGDIFSRVDKSLNTQAGTQRYSYD
jgi:hypothetical protein